MIENAAISKSNHVPLPAILGLEKAAVDVNVQRRYFFMSPLIAQRLAILKNMVGGRSMVIVVIGERGSGKTTLKNQFIANMGKGNRVGRIRLKSRQNGISQACRNLNERMIFVSKNNGLPSVIIDDAHQLSSLEIKTLLKSAFSASGKRKLQNIVLFADPGLRRRLATIARWLPPQSVIDKIYMTPLTEKQTMDYLRHRLKIAGMLHKNPFSGDQMRKIHQLSGGLPGWINGEAFMVLRRINKHGKVFKRSLIAPFIQALHGQFRWMGKIPCFSRN